jgi:hypothetical protein
VKLSCQVTIRWLKSSNAKATKGSKQHERIQ